MIGRHAMTRSRTPSPLPIILASLLAQLFAFVPCAHAENGVTATEVVIGMCNALTGPASALGTGMKKGSMVYFDKVNKAGGVNGRKVRVISYDDGYEPKNTVEQTKKLIQQDGVFALFGYVGTPTSSAVLPLINQARIPFWGPFTGAEFLRTPVNRHIFNVRGSYFDEAETQVQYLTEKRGIKRIAILYQNDAYGLAVKGGILKALKKRNLDLAGEGTYERNTEDVTTALAALKKANPEAVSMVGTYKAIAAFVRKAKAEGFDPVFLNVSFVGTAALVRELGKSGDGVIITQVMPSPRDTSVPLVAQYRADMKAAGHTELDYTDLEGYIDAVVFVETLKKAGANLSRDSFIAAAEGLNAAIGGLNFKFTPADHHALEKIYLTRIAGGQVEAVK
jgi:ABC-type branched-subunit amino acid transport system substrate-binding protein